MAYDNARIGHQTSLLPDTEVFCSSLDSSALTISPVSRIIGARKTTRLVRAWNGERRNTEHNRIRTMCNDSALQSYPSEVSQELVFRSGEGERMTLLHSVAAAKVRWYKTQRRLPPFIVEDAVWKSEDIEENALCAVVSVLQPQD